MRVIIAPYVALMMSTTLLFLVTATKESSANPVAGAAVSGAIKIISPIIQGYLGELRAARDAEQVKVRVWMHTGNPNHNGCGFWFGVTGHSGNTVSGLFPPIAAHECGSMRYDMRMTSQSAMYSTKLRLGNDQAKEIQIHADGWRDTFVKTMCFGLSERTIAGGPRAFCIDNDILKSCQALTSKWTAINLNSNDIKLTRTNRGPHKIIFKDVENLIRAFEKIDRSSEDADAAQKVCDLIELERGENSENQNCPATTTPMAIYNPRAAFVWTRPVRKEDINPDRCNRSA